MEKKDTAYFLGAGIHTCLGNGLAANLNALRQAPEPPTLHHNELTAEHLQIPYKFLGDAPLADPEQQFYKQVIQVAEQALSEAKLDKQQRAAMALFIGSSSFDISVFETRYQRELAESQQALALSQCGIALLGDYLVQKMGIRGEDYSFNSACTGSANALIAAVTQVEAGVIDHALILGVELHNAVTALGFHALGLLSNSVMMPFDPARNGMVLGEGISALIIGRAPNDGLERFYLRGNANLSDTFSITACNPDGSTVAAVMEEALANAGLLAEQVDCLKAHGTASLSSDEAEAAGMHRVFSQLPLVCALKPHIGHTLGACGLNELVLFYRAIESGFIVATPGISPDKGDLNITLNQQRHEIFRGNFMLNYFGFGGNNTSLLISNITV